MTNFRTLHKCLTLFDQFFSVYGTLLLSEGERIEREKINWTAVIVLRNAEATVSGSEAAAVVLKVITINLEITEFHVLIPSISGLLIPVISNV